MNEKFMQNMEVLVSLMDFFYFTPKGPVSFLPYLLAFRIIELSKPFRLIFSH